MYHLYLIYLKKERNICMKGLTRHQEIIMEKQQNFKAIIQKLVILEKVHSIIFCLNSRLKARVCSRLRILTSYKTRANFLEFLENFIRFLYFVYKIGACLRLRILKDYITRANFLELFYTKCLRSNLEEIPARGFAWIYWKNCKTKPRPKSIKSNYIPRSKFINLNHIPRQKCNIETRNQKTTNNHSEKYIPKPGLKLESINLK